MSAGEAAGKVATLGYTLLAARTLTRGDFGAFSYALAFATLLASVPSWGFDPVLVQRGSPDKGEIPRLLAEVVTLRAAIALPLFAVAGAVAAYFRPSERAAVALGLVMIAILGDLYGDGVRAAAAAAEDQAGVAIALIVQRATTSLAAIALLVSGAGLVGVAAGYCLGSVLGACAISLAARRIGIRPQLRAVTWPNLQSMLRGSVSLGVATLVGFVLFRFDAVLLSALKGDATLAVYIVAYRLFETSLVFSWTIGRAILPVMSADPQPATIKYQLEAGVGALSFIYLPFAALMLVDGGRVLGLIFGSQYQVNGVGPLRCLALGPFFFAVWILIGYAMVALGRPRVVLIGSAAAMAYNIIANVLTIPRWGGVAAGTTTTTAYILGAAVMLVSLRRHIGLPRLARTCLPAAAASVVFLATVRLLAAGTVIDLLGGGLAYLLVWMVAARWAPASSTSLLRRLQPQQLRPRA
jgi:O-antigen/teichoic acid export membrane protein